MSNRRNDFHVVIGSKLIFITIIHYLARMQIYIYNTYPRNRVPMVGYGWVYVDIPKKSVGIFGKSPPE